MVVPVETTASMPWFRLDLFQPQGVSPESTGNIGPDIEKYFQSFFFSFEGDHVGEIF